MILEWEGCEIYAVQQTSFSDKISCRIQAGTGCYVVPSSLPHLHGILPDVFQCIQGKTDYDIPQSASFEGVESKRRRTPGQYTGTGLLQLLKRQQWLPY